MPSDAPAPAAVDWRPALPPSVRRRHDQVRGAELLLMPERVVRLNAEGGRVLRLCDGRTTVEGIVTALARDFPDAPIAADVPAFLARLRDRGWLR
ncbi:pyrroloquinoline quinone biosynthesis peptide chaperone PqqD [Spirillospora sp. NPDC047279]|uniref:pyrroloquinoline quinone biosynthesis peptide chaperone PqqD n=1 Tax=Spirillospora sp. NPDC047279 TaxID=3155478 RepID=UPI00340C8727